MKKRVISVLLVTFMLYGLAMPTFAAEEYGDEIIIPEYEENQDNLAEDNSAQDAPAEPGQEDVKEPTPVPSEESEDFFSDGDTVEDDAYTPIAPDAPEGDIDQEDQYYDEQPAEEIQAPIMTTAGMSSSGDCGAEGDNVKWSYSNGTLRFTGTGAMEDYEYSLGQPYRTYIFEATHIVIENGITRIGDNAFYSQNFNDIVATISIPDSVTSIGDYAFASYKFSEFTIPKNVNKIGEGAFEMMEVPGFTVADGNTSFTAKDGVLFNKAMTTLIAYPVKEAEESYSIPDGVMTIGKSSFVSCNTKEIVMPDSVITIESMAFYGSQAEHYSLSENLKTIGEYAFSGAHILEIVLPESVEVINKYAFSTMALERITILNPNCEINETFDEYDEGAIGQRGVPVIVGYEGSTAEEFANKYGYKFEIVETDDEPQVISGSFNYYSEETKSPNQSYVFDYDDNWFFNNSYTYQPDLAKMSLRMAMASMDTSGSNIGELYDDLKFKDKYIDYPTPPGENTIGYSIAHKNLNKDGEKITVIAITIRSGCYVDEWAGNFMVGSGQDHEGFNFASAQVVSGLNQYISEFGKGFYPNIKVWISGYSRGAAVTNLVGKRLDDGEIRGISANNVFAYGFESPKTTKGGNAASSTYYNLFSVINPIDLVTKVPLETWGYTWYGLAYYLPSPEYDSNYKQLWNNMLAQYQNIASGYASNSRIRDLAYSVPSVSYLYDSFADGLGDVIPSSIDYYYNYETSVMWLARKYLGSGYENAGHDFIDELLKLLPQVGGFSVRHLSLVTDMLAYGSTRIFPNHYPELCLAWVDSLNGRVVKRDLISRRVYINCPVDVSVTDERGNIVGQITNNEVVSIENGVGVYIDDDGQKVICLPVDGKYDVGVTATGTGVMTYTATEVDSVSGRVSKVVSYANVNVQAGDTFTGFVDSLASTSNAQYPLQSKGENLEPTTSVSGAEVVKHTVTVTTEGEGLAVGGGTYVTGEYCRVWVESGAENFAGWYIGSELVSSETEYRMLVTSDIKITAKFNGSTSPTPTPTPTPSTPSTTPPTNGWFTDDNGAKFYYKNGKTVKGWNYIDSEWYYFDDSGCMVTGDWAQDKYGWYFLGADGKMMSGFSEINLGRSDDGWYYFNPKHDGSFGRVLCGWQYIDGDWYYFNEKHDGTWGRMVTGDWAQDKYGWYFLDANGKMMSGFSEINLGRSDDGWYYFNPKHDGSFGRVLCGWQYINGDWYYFNEKHNGAWGRMVTGNWAQDAKYWYFLGEDGKMLSGLQEINLGRSDDGIYYFNTAHDGTYGRMMTGWQEIDGDLYYFETRHNGTYGAALRNSIWTINGWFCAFDENGVCYVREYIGW